jgi:transcriptional regulator with XRE-family HTH domain
MNKMGENIRKIRESRGYTRAKLEEMTGIGSIYHKETGLRGITEKDLNVLSKALNCLKSDIVGDTELYKNISSNAKLINKYDISGMKNSSINDIKNIIETINFDSSFLKKEMGSDNLILIKYHNNLMYPFIQYGDNIYIDLDGKKFVNNGMFLINEDDKLVIRRVFKKELHKDLITLSFDNNNSGLYLCEIKDEDFAKNVIGRVVYVGRNVKDL